MERDLTKGSIWKNIAVFSLPYLLSYFLQTLYGLAGLFIIGQYEGAASITAVSVGSQIMHMLTVMIVGLAMGTTVLLSQTVGAREHRKIPRIIGNSVTIFLILSLALAVLLLILTGTIVAVLQTPPEAVAETKVYLRICFAGIPFIVAYNIISSIFRGMGDSKSPMYFVAIACVINIILDYVFIGGFHIGAAGAAFGTVIAQALSVIFALLYIVHQNRRGTFLSDAKMHRTDFRPDGNVTRQIFRIGLPVCLQDGLIQISFLAITVIANMRGVDQAAAVGIVEKIISFCFLIPSTMMSTVSAIAAQNYGAGYHDRARKTLGAGIAIGCVIGLMWVIIAEIAPVQIVGLFTTEAVVAKLGSRYLRSYILDCIFANIHFCFSGYFTAYGHSELSFIHNITSIIVMRLPGAYIASKMFPVDLLPMGLAAPLGSVISAVICVFLYRWLQKKIAVAE